MHYFRCFVHNTGSDIENVEVRLPGISDVVLNSGSNRMLRLTRPSEAEGSRKVPGKEREAGGRHQTKEEENSIFDWQSQALQIPCVGRIEARTQPTSAAGHHLNHHHHHLKHHHLNHYHLIHHLFLLLLKSDKKCNNGEELFFYIHFS